MSNLADVWFRVTDLDVVSGEGCVVRTADGRDYLDFTSGIAVTSTGHCHPRVVEAIRDQAGRFIHAQVNIYRHPLLGRLASRLAALTPAGVDRFFFSNSGAEATEAAVKLAKAATGRPNVVVFRGGFHGRTHMTMAMTTSKTSYRAGYQPLPAGVFVAEFPRAFEWGLGEAQATERALGDLRRLLAAETAPTETAAVVIEPELGEGGYLPAPAGFLRGVEAICREHDILFVADEVQTGFGRTGAFFAVEHAGVVPDVIVMAKGLASGFPIAGIGARADLMAAWPVGSHGGTYGGSALGCAAALATIDVIEDEHLVENAADRGAQLAGRLEALQTGDPGLADVRGLGLMIGCEFVDAAGRPDAARVAAIADHARTRGRVLFMNCGTWGNVLRWMPPLVVTAEQVDVAVDAFAAALGATAA